DGLDLGPVTEEEPISHARYRELHALLAEHARDEDPILSSRLTPAVQERAAEMLHEDWLHHLVDAELLALTDPARVVEAVTDSLRIRDALGTTGAWLVPDVTEAGSAEMALVGALVVLAMPGAVYLRQGIELGLPVKTSPDPEPERTSRRTALLAEQRGVGGSHFETIRAALRLRSDHRLGLAPLARVDEMVGPVPEDVLAFLSGEILVVANVGSDDVPLPAEPEVVLTSGPLRSGLAGVPLLPPRTAAWLWLEPPAPQPDPRARRGASALPRPGGEAGGEVALPGEEAPDGRPRAARGGGGAPAPVARQLVRDPAVQPHGQRPVRLGLEDELGQEEVGEAGDEGQQRDDREDRHDEPQDDRPVGLGVGGAVDLRGLVELLRHGVEE